jgi:hypothetical protein
MIQRIRAPQILAALLVSLLYAVPAHAGLYTELLWQVFAQVDSCQNPVRTKCRTCGFQKTTSPAVEEKAAQPKQPCANENSRITYVGFGGTGNAMWDQYMSACYNLMAQQVTEYHEVMKAQTEQLRELNRRIEAMQQQIQLLQQQVQSLQHHRPLVTPVPSPYFTR